MTKQAMLELAKQLSKQDQIDLAMDLWDLVDGQSIPAEITPEFAADLDRRFAEDDADQTPGEDWQVLRAKLLRGEL